MSPFGSALLLEVPLSRSPPKRVLTDRLDPCMEKKNLTRARNERELILKLMDAVNSEGEYRYLQEELVLVESELPHLRLRSTPERRCY